MAKLTDQLSTVNSGKPIIDPGPANPSGLGALADFLGGAVPAIAGAVNQSRAKKEEERNKQWQNEAAQNIFDIQTGSVLPAAEATIQQAPTSQNESIFPSIAPFDAELEGGPDSYGFTTETGQPAPVPSDVQQGANELSRMQRGVEQGRVSKARYDAQLEASQADLMNRYPEHRAAIAQYFIARGMDHYMFRAFQAETTAFVTEQEAQNAGSRQQYQVAANAGLFNPSTTSLEAGAAIGRQHLALLAEAEATKVQMEQMGRIASASGGSGSSSADLKTAALNYANSALNMTHQWITPTIDKLSTAISMAGNQPERQTLLSQEVTRLKGSLVSAENHIVAQVVASGADQDTVDRVRSQFKRSYEQVDALVNDSFDNNKRALANLESSLGMASAQALPIYTSLVQGLGQATANSILENGLPANLAQSVQAELQNYNPADVRSGVSLARAISYMKGHLGFKDMSPEEARTYVPLNANALATLNTQAVQGNMNVGVYVPKLGNMVEASIELTSNNTPQSSIKQAAGSLATPAAREALGQIAKQDPAMGAAMITGSRSAAAHLLSLSRAGEWTDRRGITYKIEYTGRSSGDTGYFRPVPTQASYNTWANRERGRQAGTGFAERGLSSNNPSLIPSYEQVRDNPPQELKDRMINMTVLTEHLVYTDELDERDAPALAGLSAEQRRRGWIDGSILSKVTENRASKGPTSDDDFRGALGSLQSSTQDLMTNALSLTVPTEAERVPLSSEVGSTAAPLPRSELQRTVRQRGEAQGLSWGLVERVVRRESSWKPEEENTKTQARGLFQINDDKDNRSLDENINDGLKFLKEAQGTATRALGRAPRDWEVYVAHQQGVGGGSALLKPENATRSAVDVLAPLYPSRAIATQAVTNNGGTANMTAAQFLRVIKEFFER